LFNALFVFKSGFFLNCTHIFIKKLNLHSLAVLADTDVDSTITAWLREKYDITRLWDCLVCFDGVMGA